MFFNKTKISFLTTTCVVFLCVIFLAEHVKAVDKCECEEIDFEIRKNLTSNSLADLCAFYGANPSPSGDALKKIGQCKDGKAVAPWEKDKCELVFSGDMLSYFEEKLKKFSDVEIILWNITCKYSTSNIASSPTQSGTPSQTTQAGQSSEKLNGDCQESSPGILDCALANPLGTSINSTTDVNTLIGKVVAIALGLVGALSLFAFVQGGMTWFRSFGNPEKIKQGMHTMLFAVMGLLVTFLSYAVLKWIMKLIATGKAW
ncbi:MAG: hypothetical protein ABIH87_02220 [bacterium]